MPVPQRFHAPGRDRPSGLPVMVHLHGGSNSGFWPYENATAFVAHDVIVVTLAYRLGVFGFVGHPTLSAEGGGASGEYGVLDQIAALEWVQRNIAAFGGDPETSPCSGNPPAPSMQRRWLLHLVVGLFVRAALQTEAFDAFYDPGSIADAETLGLAVADSLGCSSAADVAGCLRARPAEDLVLALGFIDVKPRIGGEILSASPRDLIAAHDATVPLLVGSNREEATFQFEEPFTGEAFGQNAYADTTKSIVAPDAGRIVRSLYPIHAYDNALWAGIALWTDGIYTCPIRALASTSSGPVWRYLYTHVYDNNVFLAGLRASHFIDDPIMWHDPALLEGFGAADYAFSPAEDRLSAVMTGYWTNFAKTGDPNGPGLAEWPRFTDANHQTLVLDDPITCSMGGATSSATSSTRSRCSSSPAGSTVAGSHPRFHSRGHDDPLKLAQPRNHG